MNKCLLRVVVLLCLGAGLVAGCGEERRPADQRGAKESGLKASRIWDGDSFVLDSGVEVRLIGIDAPERDEPGADQARDFLKGLITGKELRIEKGAEEKDKHNRSLYYVYANDIFINLEMIKEGYARVRYYSPDDFYYKEFANAESEARKLNKGLWAMPDALIFIVANSKPSDDIPWQDAAKYYGQIKTVEGTIVRMHNSGKACFLNFHPDYKSAYFYVVIFPADYSKFTEPPEKLYQDKKIRVRGRIKEYEGKPQIIVSDPEQIEVVVE